MIAKIVQCVRLRMGGTQFNKRYTLNALTTAYNTLQYIKPVQLIVVWWMDI
jgi:hypothetical protein